MPDAPPGGAASHNTARAGVAILAVLVPTLFVLWQFPPSLLLSNTTAAGGDLGSHNYAASWARQLLFSRHRLTGWVPGNYTGFPLFQMYFPLPFALIAAASLVLDPNVAFKLVTVLGLATLPLAAYHVLVRARTPYPGPALGASLVLLFLFQDANSMWGGNLASTLAGEFSYSISLPIALVYLGMLAGALRSWRVSVIAAALVGVLALTHAYTVLWVACASAFLLTLRGPTLPRLARLAIVFGGAAALCAFWLLPMVWYAPWTTAYRHLWVMNSWLEIVPRTLWPVFVVAFVTPVLLVARGREAVRAYWSSTDVLWAAAAAAAFEYAAAPNVGIVDIRFLPFLQLSVCLLAAAGAAHLLTGLRAVGLWIPITFLSVVVLVQAPATRMRAWIQWDYEGFESKPLWPVYEQMANVLRGGVADPRVVYEHAVENEALGTIRAFENLPLFTGRSTLEGVNMQASVTAPFVFFIQSEISQVMSCPFSEWGCSRTDLAAGVEHLKMMNVSDFIARTNRVKELAAGVADLVPRASVPPYTIYRIDHNQTGHAVALAAAPYRVTAANWKEAAYRWFKYAKPEDPVPVFATAATPAEDARFAGVLSDVSRQVPRIRREAPPLTEYVEAERITVSGYRPGEPILIRVSYHPRWQSATGERVWLAGPGFMLVFPEHNTLQLVYSETAVTRTGVALTMLALVGVAAALWRLPQQRDDADARSHLGLVIRVAAVVAAAGFVVAGVRARQLDADAVYRAAQIRFDAGDFDGARAGYIRARTLAPLSNTAMHSSYFEGITFFKQERWAEARQVFDRMVATYPEALAAAEVTYHSGLCAERLGERDLALAKFEETERRYPGTEWARYAREKLKSEN